MPKPIKARRPAKSGKAKAPEKASLPWPVIVLGAVVVVLLLVAVLLGPSMYHAVVRSGALNRIESAVDAAAEKSDFAQAAKLVEPDLEYFAEFMVQDNDMKRQQALQGILLAIPSEKLPDSCFAIPKQSVLFTTVVRIASSRPREWLIEKSSQANAELRGVAAEALATQLPSGTAPAAEIGKLAEPLTVEQKQKEFQRLYDEQHQQLEQTLVGEWTLQLHAEFRAADQTQTEDFELASRHFAIACQQQQWTVKFFNQTWTGRLEELRAVNVKASSNEVADALTQFPLRAALASSPVELQLLFAPPQAFTVQATGFPKTRPDSAWSMAQSKGSTLRIQNQEINLRIPSSPAGSTFSSFEIKESRDMPFGRIDIEASGSDGEVSIAKWRMKGEPGFSKFEVTATPASIASQRNAKLGIAGRHDGPVLAVATSPNGELCASAGADRRLMVWDVATRTRKHDFGPVAQGILDLAWSPDGKLIVSGLANGHISVVSVPGGEIKSVPMTGLQQVTAVAFHPNGQEVFCAGIEGVIRQVRIETGEVSREWNAHALRVQQLVVSADGKLLVSSSLDGTLLCWEIAAGKTRQRLIGHSDAIAAHDVSPDGQRVVSLQLDGELRQWDVATGRTLDRSQTEFRVARAVRVLPDANRVLVVTGANEVGVFDWRSKKTVLRQKTMHGHLLYDAALTRDDPPQVISGGFDHKVLFAKLESLPAPNAELPPITEKATSHGLWREWATNVADSSWCVDPQSDFFIAAARRTDLEFDSQAPKPDLEINQVPALIGWRAETGQITTRGGGLVLAHNALFAASADAHRLVTAEMPRLGRDAVQVRLWERDTNGQLSNVRLLEFPLRDVLLTPTDKERLSASELRRLDGNAQKYFPVRSIVVSPSGRWAAIGTNEHTICFYDLQSAKLVRQFIRVLDQKDPLREKSWSRLSHQPVFLTDEEFVAGGFVIETTNLEHNIEWNIPELKSELSRNEGPLSIVAAVPGQRRLFTAQGREVREVRVPEFPGPNVPLTVAASPQPTGREAQGVRPRTSMPSKKAVKPEPSPKFPVAPLRTFKHEAPVTSLAISRDGTKVATGEENGQFNLWNLADGKLLRSVRLDTRPIRQLEFVSNGERIASGHADGTIRIWNLADFNDGS